MHLNWAKGILWIIFLSTLVETLLTFLFYTLLGYFPQRGFWNLAKYVPIRWKWVFHYIIYYIIYPLKNRQLVNWKQIISEHYSIRIIFSDVIFGNFDTFSTFFRIKPDDINQTLKIKVKNTVELIKARVFSRGRKPTLVFFSLVRNWEKLHSESKYDESFDKIDSFDFLFLTSFDLSFAYIAFEGTSSSVGFKANIWMVPLSLLHPSHWDFMS